MGYRNPQPFEVEHMVSDFNDARDLYQYVGGVEVGEPIQEYTVQALDVELDGDRIVINVYLDTSADRHQSANFDVLQRRIAPSSFELQSMHTTCEEQGNRVQFTVTLE